MYWLLSIATILMTRKVVWITPVLSWCLVSFVDGYVGVEVARRKPVLTPYVKETKWMKPLEMARAYVGHGR